MRKKSMDKEIGLFKDIATKLKEESERLPTSAQVIEHIKQFVWRNGLLIHRRVDNEELKKIDARIAKETADLQADHSSCPPVNYKRDYSAPCPDGEKATKDRVKLYIRSNGLPMKRNRDSNKGVAHFGRHLKGNALPTQNLPSSVHYMEVLVDPYDGHIVAPRH
ncbi:hypothetical protein BgAZ_500270 [Babesia gibsoni]|uniref:Uncharacterized protein n=1 Tax=Babesia gibsoni TaxID=33632 RepID=A0AAD8LFM3_BABGI|nr:hypothetical protein BgAZ_500270 [Babesia gibsoni]